MNGDRFKEIYRRYIEEVWHQKDFATIDRLFAADYVDHAAPPMQEPGVPGAKWIIGYFLSAFPDVHIQIEDMLVEGDKLMARLSSQGTHQGELFGLPPTHKQFQTTGIHIVRFREEKMVEHWANNDDLGLLRQLGALPG
jgi:predicted ester cyclase